jgi:hypothetical protein
MSHLRLLSTDFDGTLIEHFSDGRCTAEFAEVLSHHKKAGGYWAINTGRSLWHAIEGVKKFAAPVEPDFLLTNERDIFHRGKDGQWIPDATWNEECRRKHDELFAKAEPLFQKIHRHAKTTQGLEIIIEDSAVTGVVTSTEEMMDEFVTYLEKASAQWPDFSYQRNTIYLRFAHRDYHKGSALNELCRILEISHHEVLAAGDHFNDLSMLDGQFAAHVCCPSNAIPEVQETVRAAGGHIASKAAANGIAEAWHFFHANIKK